MKPVKIEMYYTLACPNCKILKQLLDEVLPQYGENITLKKSLASSPIGMIRSMKLGIHTVPTLLINDDIVFRSVPTKNELIETLNNYIK